MLFKLTNAGDIDELIEYVELIKEKNNHRSIQKDGEK